MAIITLATDFGRQDGYNGAVIGVIKTMSPRSEVVEITSELGSILKASLVLWRYYSQYPLGTIHLVVVDPTVGTERRALVGTDGKYLFVGPDNGLFTRIIEDGSDSTWYEIDTAKLPVHELSYTFHARDIFAPAAAMLSIGKAPEILGRKIADPVTIELPEPAIKGNMTKGEIIDIDSFGNLIINIPGEMLRGEAKVMLREKNVPLHQTFADVKVGYPVAYIGSLGLLEVAVNRGRADSHFRAKVGTKVIVKI
jgi:S-adenosylmethionine hydrolase